MCSNENLLAELHDSFTLYARVAFHFKDVESLDLLISSLYKMTGFGLRSTNADYIMRQLVENKKFRMVLALLFELVRAFGNGLCRAWKDVSCGTIGSLF